MLTEFFQLLENKNRFIDANPNLTDEQKQELKAFFLKYPHLEGKVGDWQKSKEWTWETFQPLMAEAKKTNFEKKKENIEGLALNGDYRIIYEDENIQAYEPYTHKGSWVLASNAVGPEVWTGLPGWYEIDNANKDYLYDSVTGKYSGAKWCISMRHTSRYWDDYTDRNIKFLFIMEKNASPEEYRKVALVQHLGRNDDSDELGNIEAFTARDDSTSASNYLHDNPMRYKIYQSWIKRLIPTGEEYVTKLVAQKVLTKVGDAYDCKDPKKVKLERLFDETEGTFVKFNVWHGNWNCNGSKFMYDHCPKKVIGDFNCSNLELTTLEGLQLKQIRGSFICQNNHLTSLKGAPELIGQSNLLASHNDLTTFEGMPEVAGLLDVSKNPELKSYDGLKLADTGWIVTRGTGLENEEE